MSARQSLSARARANEACRAVDLWEISIVTFPLLAGARVRAVKHSPPRSQSGFALAEQGATSTARQASFARARAERDWRALIGGAAEEPVEVVRRRLRRRMV